MIVNISVDVVVSAVLVNTKSIVGTSKYRKQNVN
jgi:hypothetical protein